MINTLLRFCDHRDHPVHDWLDIHRLGVGFLLVMGFNVTSKVASHWRLGTEGWDSFSNHRLGQKRPVGWCASMGRDF